MKAKYYLYIGLFDFAKDGFAARVNLVPRKDIDASILALSSNGRLPMNDL